MDFGASSLLSLVVALTLQTSSGQSNLCMCMCMLTLGLQTALLFDLYYLEKLEIVRLVIAITVTVAVLSRNCCINDKKLF